MTDEQRKKKRDYQRQWRRKNLERAREIDRKSRKRRRKHIKEKNPIYYLNWKNKNPERARRVQLKAYVNFKKNHPKYWLAQYRKNRKARLASYHKHRKNHTENVKHTVKMSKAKKKGYIGSYSLAEWNELKEIYKYTCPKCQLKEPEIVLTADHIKPLEQGGTNYIDNIQPLCRKCNASKFTKFIKY